MGTPVWRAIVKVPETTTTAAANAASGSPFVTVKWSDRLVPRSGWTSGAPGSSARSGSTITGSGS